MSGAEQVATADASGGMAELGHRPMLDLAYPFSGEVEAFADLFEIQVAADSDITEVTASKSDFCSTAETGHRRPGRSCRFRAINGSFAVHSSTSSARSNIPVGNSMPRDLAVRLLVDDCCRMLAEIEERQTARIVDMLEWLRDVYCKGMPPLRVVQIEEWVLELSAIGGVDLVWLSLKNKKAGIVPQK